MQKSNKVTLMLLSMMFVVLATASVSAWAPSSHNELVIRLFEDSSSKIIQDCKPYGDAFLLGSVTPDITVIYYYSNGGNDYKITHNWNFADEVMQQAKTPDEVCFAYGIGAHLIADSVSHNELVPSIIKKTKIPNWLVHPLTEQKFDSVMLSEHPELENKTAHMMDALYGPHGDRYAEMVQKALGSNTDLVAKDEMIKLSLALNTFFQTQYKPSGSTLIFKVYPAIAKLTYVLYPVIGKVNSGEVNAYYDKAETLLVSSYGNWGSRYTISPHGFDALNEADSQAQIFTWIYVLAALGIPIGLALWRKSWWYLIGIPMLFILEVVVVYVII